MPFAPSPMAALELVHAKEAPAGLLTKLLTLIVVPGQTAIFVIGFTVGFGYIVTVKVIGVPRHPLIVGVTEIVAVILAPVPLLGAVQEAILPEPPAISPMAVLELVQTNVAPIGVLTKFPILIVELGHTAILVIGTTVGVGKIVTVNVIGGP